MNNFMEKPLVKRIKSFLWRAGAVGVAATFAYATQDIQSLQLNEWQTVVLGLVLGEISKYLNTK
jgi:hypothetical protein